MDYDAIALDIIYNYLNSPSKYSKDYILKNFNSAISILKKNLEDYFNTNASIKSMQQGQRQVTYKDTTIKSLIDEVKLLLPLPERKAIVYV